MSVATPLRSLVEAARLEHAPADYVPLRGLDLAGDEPLVVLPWSRWGKHRLYVNTADGEPVGWVDRHTGECSLALPELASEFQAAVDNHADTTYRPRRGLAGAAELDRDPGALPTRMVQPEPVDLLGNRPGEQLEARITATLEAGEDQQPMRPGFAGRRAYSSWELGLLGERVVAEELDRLVALDPRWSYINSIPVGTNNSDIDHLIVGPGGVFTINAKHHHDGKVWVAEDALMVNGTWTQYVRNSRHEAERAGKLLSTTAHATIIVRGVVVTVGVAELTVKEQPADVQVLDACHLVDFMMSQPTVLDDYTTALVLTCARLSTTWRPVVANSTSG